jgi:hypothetical protein
MRRPSSFLAVLFAAGLSIAGCGTTSTDADSTDAAQDTSAAGLAIGTTTMLGNVSATSWRAPAAPRRR